MAKTYLGVRWFGKKILEGEIAQKKIREKIDKIIKSLKRGHVKVEHFYNPLQAGYMSATMRPFSMKKEINGKKNAWKIVEDAFKKIAKKDGISELAKINDIPFYIKAKQFGDDVFIEMDAARHSLLGTRHWYSVEIKGTISK